MKKPAEKRPKSGQITEVPDPMQKRQRLDDLERTYHELISANEYFQDKCLQYRTQKQMIDFINTPNFLKFR